MMPAASRPHGIYAFAPVSGWNNQQITKNCGLVPYLFHKLWGWHAVMVGKDNGPYPALADVPGLELVALPTAGATMDYLVEHVGEIDVLVLHGVFPINITLAARYRALRPDGKIYLEADANRFYEERIPMTQELEEMLLSCDVVGASCRRIQRWLSAKWPCRVDYVPNGFYDLKGAYKMPDFTVKEDVILTVARLGSPEKRTEDLMLAFAQIAEAFPAWTLRLVGGVDERFRPFVDAYFEKFPELRDRVVFTGAITDKAQLLAEYRRAKIFALMSSSEGGTPNVIAEALYGGCYMVTSEVDGADDIIAGGACGQKYPVADARALANCLRRVCSNPAIIEHGGRAALAYGRETFDFIKIVRRLYCLLGLFSGREVAVHG